MNIDIDDLNGKVYNQDAYDEIQELVEAGEITGDEYLTAEQWNKVVNAIRELQAAAEVPKFGAFRTTIIDSYVHILCFSTEADAMLYDGDPTEHSDLLLQSLRIPISTAQGGTTYAARLIIHADNAPSKAIVSITNDYKVKVRFCGIQTEAGYTDNAGIAGTLTIQRSINGGVTWTTVGTQYLDSRDDSATTTWDEVNLGQYFSTTNPQQLRVRVSFSVLDDDGKTVATAQSAWQTWSSVTYTQLSVQNMVDFHRPVMATGGFPLSFAVGGAVDKVLHVTISGSNGTYTYTSPVIPAATEYPTTSPLTWTESEQSSIGILAHGVHTVTAWVTCEDGDGNTLESDTVINRFMVVNRTTSGADLTAPRLMLQQVQTRVTNYVRTVLAKFAVWIPDASDPTVASSDTMAVSIRLTDYGETDTGYGTEYMHTEMNVSAQTTYDIDTTVEVEGSDATYMAYLRIFRYDGGGNVVNFMRESLGLANMAITVDNAEDYSPSASPTFVLNPKTRNNSESNPFTIINAATGAVVPSTWTGFSGGSHDAWTTDGNGQRVLRVRSGQNLTIQLEPFQRFITDGEASLSIGIDFSVSDITQEDEPVLQICQTVAGELLGLKMLPLVGYIKCVSYQDDSNQNFPWQEGVRTHMMLVINPSVVAKASDELTWQQTPNGAVSHPLSLAKVYINGNPYREMVYAAPGTRPLAGTWCKGEGHGGIRIGCPHAGIDIYGIRIYDRALSAQNTLQDRIAALPTADEKYYVKQRNAITTNGRIDYEKTKAKGYRCLTLVGQDQYKGNQDKNGYPCYWRIDHDIPALSGTIGKAAYLASLAGTLGGASCLMVTPQGSTANTYWANNEQTKVDGITYVINIPFSKLHSDFGWTAAKSTGEDCDYPMYLNGTRIEGTSYASLSDEQKTLVTIDVPDGWFDGNGWSETVAEMGMYHGQFYTSYIGAPKCTKLVNKINYASPMQSHKKGATRLYHDVMMAVTGGNSMTKAGARFSVYEEEFMFFTEHPQDNGKVEFRGMCTFGDGKFDKAVFGYKADKRVFGFEGLNNNLPLCDFRVPADGDVTYDPDEESWCYNGTKSFEYGLGDTKKVEGKKYPTDINDTVFRRYVNFFYCHGTSLLYHVGTKTDFIAKWNAIVSAAVTDASQAALMAEMQTKQYWCTQGVDAFCLLRFDFVTGTWVDAGTWDQDTLTYSAGVRNLSTDDMTATAYAEWSAEGSGDYSNLNNRFRLAIANHGATYMSSVAHVENHLTHYDLVNFLMAGTDNCSKNLYYVYDPVTGQIWLYQDDLDSILLTDNNGRQTKVYFLDRIHDLEDYNNGYKGQVDYEGRGSSLFNFIETAYEAASNGLRTNMRSVLSAMSSLVGVGEGYGVSVYGCIEKYFFSTQEYFPEVAYAEQARLRYEWPKSFGYISTGNQARGVDPITQQVGSQLEGERQYMKRRLAYVASYACWGDFSAGVIPGVIGLADSSSSLSISPGSGYTGSDYTFTLTPHQWLYPTGFKDRVAVDPHVRVAPGGSYTFKVASAGDINGDSAVGLCALNYYRKIGNLGDMTCHNAALTVTANP